MGSIQTLFLERGHRHKCTLQRHRRASRSTLQRNPAPAPCSSTLQTAHRTLTAAPCSSTPAAAPCSSTLQRTKHSDNSSYTWSKNPNSFATWGRITSCFLTLRSTARTYPTWKNPEMMTLLSSRPPEFLSDCEVVCIWQCFYFVETYCLLVKIWHALQLMKPQKYLKVTSQFFVICLWPMGWRSLCFETSSYAGSQVWSSQKGSRKAGIGYHWMVLFTTCRMLYGFEHR